MACGGSCSASDAALKIQFQGELNESRVITRRDDPPEIACTAGNDLAGVLINAGRRNGVEVADRICKIDVIEEVEELGAELDVLCFVNREAFNDGEVHVTLPWPAQGVAPDIADVGAGRIRAGHAV